MYKGKTFCMYGDERVRERDGKGVERNYAKL